MSASDRPTSTARPAPVVRVFRAANKLVRPLLGSRFHRLLSGRLMLLTYNGYKTGREFTVPIGYFDWDPGTVLAMSSQLGWIPSLRGGSPVRLRIRGVVQGAVPTVIEDTAEVAALLGEFVDRKGAKAAKGLMLGLPGDRRPTDEELRTAAGKTRLVRFRLQTSS
ncbi:hypothetical protein [Streptomyces sp. GQFP]|uniref:hypothetical protein n=1 Tax=Streptomyces sp. GQFP TaxID=2907545 RepID=UPI001F4180B1|nr:hypothetical protein [Streptomyces sp. GQFP]UIX29138.1 hypothetical protein LUX31_03375 [Streptomyces sp. GQFP]